MNLSKVFGWGFTNGSDLSIFRNRRRMQNMILAVGPGTPASCVLTSVPAESDVAGADSESNDEDDIYNATDDEDDAGISHAGMLESEEEEEEEEEEEDLGEEGHSEEIGETEAQSDDDSELEIIAEADEQNEDHLSTASQEDRLEAEAEIARHLAARPVEEQAEDQDDKHYGRSAWTRRQNSIKNALTGGGSSTDEESNHTNGSSPSQNESTSDSDSDSENYASSRRADQVLDFIEQQIRRQQRRRQRSQLSSLSSARDNSQLSQQYEREVARSMKHGGCINTASWLDCGWRISTASHEDAHPYDRFYNEELFGSSSYSANENCYSTPVRNKQTHNDGLALATCASEYPTQLLTSGDDHLVKFWDVSQSMGSTSPLPGGSATVSPFSSPRAPMKPTSELLTVWRKHVHPIDIDNCTDSRHKRHLPGIVHPLLTLSTGHRGNVFHVTPIPNVPGKVLTCAADGFVRLTDVEINATSSPAGRSRGRSNSTSSTSVAGEASTIIISPEYHNENGESGPAFRFRDSLMCFSHHFLSSNVGLVCSERGLLHFDLRLPPSSQKRGSLIEELSTTCKSCCVWRDYNEDSDSAYVFGECT